MPRAKSAAVQARDKVIFARVQAGESQAQLAADYGISRARLSQIIAEQVEILPDDQERAMHAAMYDGMIMEAAKLAFNSDPDPVFTVKGDVVVNPQTGEVAYDNISHMKVKLDAMKSMDTFMMSRRKMFAHDMPRKQELPKEAALASITEWLDQWGEDIVRGEIISEGAEESEADHNGDTDPKA